MTRSRPESQAVPLETPIRAAGDGSALFIPPIAICILHDDPRLAPWFDAKYGDGLAAKYLAVH